MSNYNNLKTTIDANIKQNGNQEITGPILNSVLNQMVNILGTGYQFAGVATLDPATDPGTPDAKVFYIANGKGTYTNFGGLEVTEDEVVVLYWDSAWHKVSTGIASQAKLSELSRKVSDINQYFGEDKEPLFTEYGFWNDNGVFNSTTSAQNTGYIDVMGISSVECLCFLTNSGYVIAFFNENKDLIDGVLGDSTFTVKTALVPSSAKYVAFCNYGEQPLKYAKVIAYDDSIIKKTNLLEQEKASKASVDRISNILSMKKVDVSVDGYINSTDGTINASSYGKCTEFIPVENFATLKYANGGGNETVASVAFYDDEKIFLPSLVIRATDSLAGVVILNDETHRAAKYVRLSYYKYGTIPIPYENFLCELRTKENIIERVDGLDNSNGLNILVFGDSITDCCSITIANGVTTSYAMRRPSNSYKNSEGEVINYDMWAYIMQNALSCKEVRNYALSGASYKNQGDGTSRLSVSYQVNLALADLNNAGGAFNQPNFEPDIVIFALGTNDGIPNDTPDSAISKTVYNADNTVNVDATLNAMDKSKFCESVLWAYLTIKKNFPLALCFSVLPLQRGSNDVNIGKLHSYLEAMAHRYGYIIIDGTFESGIIRETASQTLKDGLHPNEKGQNLMARMIISAIKRNYFFSKDMNP